MSQRAASDQVPWSARERPHPTCWFRLPSNFRQVRRAILSSSRPRPLMPVNTHGLAMSRSGAKQILKDTSIPAEEYQMGVTKAFIKTPRRCSHLKHMRDRYWHNMAVRIQRAWRNYLRYRIECAIRIQRFWRRMNGGLEFIKVRDQGHKSCRAARSAGE